MSGRLGMVGDASARGDKAVFGKSFVPGKGYRRAADLTRGERWKVRQGVKNDSNDRLFGDKRGPLEHHGFSAKGNQIWPQVKLQRGSLRPTTHQGMPAFMPPDKPGQRTLGVAFPNGRGGGAVHFADNPPARHTIMHEAAHIAPRRNPVRMQERIQNPKRQGGEEGRADFVAAGGRTPKRYPGNHRFQWGYRDVQDKMAAAQKPTKPILLPGRKKPSGPVIRRPGSMANDVEKIDTTMSDSEAKRLAQRYDTRGPLPKELDRDSRMKAYEARYIAAGGKQGEKWKRRADHAETGRNIGLAGATTAGALMLGRKAPGLRRIPRHALEHGAVAAGTFGGASELYGEHARSRRASYQNSPAGVAGSALSRMQAYTPGRKS